MTSSSLLIAFASIGLSLHPYEAVEQHMGTLFRIKLYAADQAQAQRAFQLAFARVAELDNTLSDYKPDSELNRLCKSAVHQPVHVSDDLFRVVNAAEHLSEETAGAFDITIGPLTHLWREARKKNQVPDGTSVEQAKAKCGFGKLHIDNARHTIELEREGMQLDAGGIAKGFAADESLAVLRRCGIASALVAASGDLAFGDAPPGEPGWKIGVDSVDHPAASFTRVITLSNAAVSTSGASEQHLDRQGIRYSHIIDPVTGLGLTRDSTVTVVAPHGIEADAMATAVSVLGPDRGLAFIQKKRGVSALIAVNENGQMQIKESTGFAKPPVAKEPDLPHVETTSFAPAIAAQITEAETAAHTHPDDAQQVGAFGMVLHAYNQYAGAAAAYLRAAHLEPGNFQWVYLHAKAEFDAGHFDSAAKDFAEALTLQPKYLPAQLYIGECLIASADWDAAQKLYRGMVQDQSQCPQAWYELGRTQAAKGDHAGSAASYRRACELFPRYGAAHFALAGELRKTGSASDAAEHLKAYSQTKDQDPPLEDAFFAKVRSLNQSSTVHFQRAAELDAAGKLDEAVREHQAILAADPNNLQAHVNLISLYARLGDAAQAKQHFETASTLDAGRSDAWYNYGVLLFSEHQLQSAEQAFQQALKLTPDYAEAHNNLGAVFEMQGRLEDAAKEFRSAIASKPDYPLARFHLARLLVNQRDYDGAIQQLERALQPEEENTPMYTYALAAACARAGDRERALRYYRLAHERAAAHGQARLLATIDQEMQHFNSQR